MPIANPAVHQTADVAGQVNETQTRPCGPQLRRILFRLVTQGDQFGMAEQRVVVDGDLAVQGHDLAVGHHRQRVDLGQGTIFIEINARQRRQGLFDLRSLLGCETESVRHAPRLVGLQTRVRVDHGFQDLLRPLVSDFLDLDTALGTGHQYGKTNCSIENNAGINLAHNLIRGVHHQDLRHLLAVLGSLQRHQRILEHDLCDRSDILALGHEFDAAIAHVRRL